ncbi:MAG: MoxR family ATPase [Rubripirellula sp.]|nr:MoxR family ATPase [Rubripirellula sp.]
MMEESDPAKWLQAELVNTDSQGGDASSSIPPREREEVTSQNAAGIVARLPAKVGKIKSEVGKCVIGQEQNTEAILYALFSYGHCLLEGVPGLGKTLLVRAIARVLELDFKRIQFTPDLMPPDITGTDILQEDESGHREFQFVRGPIFTQILLADEINRTPPKTQAALLEAMQERTVTVSGRTDQLPEPFLVLATQNPIEQEGTYPLPEAQLDRFLFQLQLGYPTHEQETQIVAGHSFTPLDGLSPQLSWTEVMAYRDAISHIPAASNVIDYATRIVRATRPSTDDIPAGVGRWIRWGASPRASQNLVLAGRARAACNGRFNVACEDIAAVAPMVLRHRIIRSFQADAEQKSTDDIIQQLMKEIPQAGSRTKR